MLTKLGADIGLIDVEGKTPVHWAAASDGHDSPKLVTMLIGLKPRSESKTVINWQDYEGRQPLHCAVTQGNDAVVAALIKSSSCMLNGLDHRLRSALHWAALAGKATVTRLLLERGAKADLADEAGATAVHLAILSGDPATVAVFVTAGLGDTRDLEGRTPLMWAVASGRQGVLEALQGVDTDLVDGRGSAALHILVSTVCSCASKCVCVPSSVETLLEMGAKPEQGNTEGLTALLLAAQLGHTDITTTLLRHHAKVTQEDKSQRTALHLAAQVTLILG